MHSQPLVSIIIPVYNAAQYIERCLLAVMDSTYSLYEAIVVDDGSTDESAIIAQKMGAKILKRSDKGGPAAARNDGANQAQGGILLFIDSDVLIQRETVARVVADFTEDPDIAAVFGSYDDDPAEKNFISQFKNLFHHFIHQQSSSDASTFWAGCGAIRREVFQKVGGFDHQRYKKPEIEDIDLGYRMKHMGYRILLDKSLQVKHLKRWQLGSMLCADIFCRAVPWTRLMLEEGKVFKDLNLQASQRASASLAGLSVAVLPFSFFEPRLLPVLLVSGIGILILNHPLYRFFLKRKGFAFTAFSFPMHLFYFVYSGVTFVVCWWIHRFNRRYRSSS
jgi:glycosyltransferase involved in cell wall biosynthesis